MVVLEAMSHKLPVIVSSAKYCGFSEHLNGDNALIISNPKDLNELAKYIKILYSQVELRDKIAENGLQKSQTISWENTTKNTLDAYEKIL